MEISFKKLIGIIAGCVFLVIIIVVGLIWFIKSVPEMQKIETYVIFSDIAECVGMDAFEESDYMDAKAPPSDTVIGKYVKIMRWEDHNYNVICYAFQNDAQALDYWKSQGQSDKVLQDNSGYHMSSGLFGTRLSMMHQNRVCIIDSETSGESFVSFYQWFTGHFSDAYLKRHKHTSQ